MDPKACLQAALRAYVDGDFHTAAAHLRYYNDWRRKGGFEPAMELGGDAFAEKLKQDIAEHGVDIHEG